MQQSKFWYLSIRSDSFDYRDDLADARVLMEKCVQQGETWCKFIVATENDMSKERDEISKVFDKMKGKLSSAHRDRYILEIWDEEGLAKVEKKLGLKV